MIMFLRTTSVALLLSPLGLLTTSAQDRANIPEQTKQNARKEIEAIKEKIKKQNLQGLDKNNQKFLDEGQKKFDEVLKRNQAASKMVDKLKAKKPEIETVQKIATEAFKNVDPEFLKTAQASLQAGVKTLKDQPRKPASTASSKPAPPAGRTFAEMAPPTILQTPPEPTTRSAPLLDGDRINLPAFTLDGKGSDDIRARTYVINGNCRVRQTTMALDCDDLTVILKENADEGKPAGKGKPDPLSASAAAPPDDNQFERIDARGKVRLIFINGETIIIARGGSMIYEDRTGMFVLTGWPEFQRGEHCFIADRADAVLKLYKNGFKPGATGTAKEEWRPENEGMSYRRSSRNPTAADVPNGTGQLVPTPSPVAKPKDN